MRSTLDSVPAGVITLSEDMRILAANRTMGDLVARPAQELVGQTIDVVLSAPSQILFQTHVYPALKADGRVDEIFLTLASGSERVPVLFNAARALAADPPAYDVLVVRIRARARWEQDLLAATRALERERSASRQLADELARTARELETRYAEAERSRKFWEAFIGVVSHELRTPLTTIYGMSHLVRERHAAMSVDDVTERLADIEDEADRLRRLTEDLLVLSRAEGGRLVIAEDPVSLAHVVRAAVAGEQKHASGHRFTTDLPADLPLVLGEDLYVEQVVRNLVGNAAKYSPPGTTVEVVAAEADGGVTLRVLDEGPGLRGQSSERLFDLFYRSPEAVAKSGGAGIGLFVCRELIGAMGGRVWARDRPSGRGAEFGFWLPVLDTADRDYADSLDTLDPQDAVAQHLQDRSRDQIGSGGSPWRGTLRAKVAEPLIAAPVANDGVSLHRAPALAAAGWPRSTIMSPRSV